MLTDRTTVLEVRDMSIRFAHEVVNDETSEIVARTTLKAAHPDIRAPFPALAQGTGVVVASLVLHYFPWHETLALARRIQ